MKNLLAFILLTLSIEFIGQTFELPPDSLIRKFRVKSITTYWNDDSTKSELSSVYKFNEAGNLISEQLYDNEDSTKDIELFFYKDRLLSEHWHISTWAKFDTIRTTYTYDS